MTPSQPQTGLSVDEAAFFFAHTPCSAQFVTAQYSSEAQSLVEPRLHVAANPPSFPPLELELDVEDDDDDVPPLVPLLPLVPLVPLLPPAPLVPLAPLDAPASSADAKSSVSVAPPHAANTLMETPSPTKPQHAASEVRIGITLFSRDTLP